MAKTETVGARIRRLRQERGLSQRDVSSPGCSYAYVSRVERDARAPSVRALRQLAEKLDVSADYLETGEQPFTVLIDPVGWRAQAVLPDDAIHIARDLLDRARNLGHKVPTASFFGPDGRLVRASVTRTDLAVDMGRCWCGRGALRVKDGVPFCSSPHEVLWGQWTDNLRARVVAARFIGIYGGGVRCPTSLGSTRTRATPDRQRGRERASATSRTRTSARKSAGRRAATTSSSASGSAAAAPKRKGGG